MTLPPPPLKQWSRKNLMREVERLRAILREHAETPGDPVRSGGDLVDVLGDPHARGGVILDTRHAVLMDAIDVTLVDTKQGETPAMGLLLQGRVNFSTERSKQLYMFGPDGAAGLASELIELAHRAGGEFADEFAASFKTRMEEMP